MGGHRCTAEQAAAAETVGRLLAERGAIVLCGGLSGVMEAAARGAKAVPGSLTVGFLPGDDPGAANRHIDVALATGMGEMRNALIVRAARAVIAIGGGWGTLSEVALARRIGKPVIGLGDAFGPGVDILRAETAQEAVAWVGTQLFEETRDPVS